jgi:LysR family transcriptional regulator (chromosome initiation inhibitor)
MKLLSPQLQAFLKIAKLGTVHAAADALNLTQTAVTQRIKTLEIRLKTALFMRSRRGMFLTKEGESLLRYCHSFLELEGEALSSVTQTGTEKNVSICLTGPTTIMRSRIIPQCIKVVKKFPQLLIQFDINDNENRIHSLRNGNSQLAIIEKHWLSGEMQYKKLKPENYVLVAPSQWKNRRLKDIIKNEKIIDFDTQDKMTFNYLKQYDLFDLASTDRHLTNRTDTLALLIENEVGYGVLPLEFAKSYLNNKQLIVLNNGKTYSHPLVLAWFPRHQQPKYFTSLIDTCT